MEKMDSTHHNGNGGLVAYYSPSHYHIDDQKIKKQKWAGGGWFCNM